MRARTAVMTARMRAEFEDRPTYLAEVPHGPCGTRVRRTSTGQCVECIRKHSRAHYVRKLAAKRQASA